MGVWKIGCNIKIKPETRAALEEFAKRTQRHFESFHDKSDSDIHHA